MPLIRKNLAGPAPAAKTDLAAAALTLQRGTVAERWAAVRAMDDAAAVPLLAAALHNEAEPQLREAMFTALARIGTAESFAAALQHLRSDDAATRTAALDALKLMPVQAGIRLEELLRDDDADIRVLVCELARVVPGGEAALIGLLGRETSANVCAAAVEMLAETGGPASPAALEACALRFPGVPFLRFSIRLAAEQIAARGMPQRMKPGAITELQYRQLCEFLYRETGMTYDEAKRYYIERRVADRMLVSGAANFGDYFSHLRSRARGELENLINAVTVNETYFYREDYQLHCLTRHLLPRRLAAKRPSPGIRIWSLPCATGEEPFSIAIWLLENWPEVDAHEIEIIGSDIDTQVLEAARGGIYGRRALMRLEAGLVARYFEPVDDENWRIIEDLRNSVQFSAANAVEPADTSRFGRFDVIFCRNMLIYFDDASRRLAAENLYEALLPGGYLCLGHAESMSRISALFEVCRYDDIIVYRRPGGAA